MNSVVRDNINLNRLLPRLEKAVNGQDWDNGDQNVWIKSLEVLQTVKFAKRLLNNVQSSGELERYQDIRTKLNRFEELLKSVQQRSKPKSTRPTSVLSSIPKPVLEPEPAQLSSAAVPEEPPESAALLTVPEDVTFAAVPAKSSSPAVSSAFLENSKVRQEAMTEQVVQMAVQLRKNAQHFSKRVEEDKAVVEETSEKLDGNLVGMQKERVRLRDHRGKSTSTTWIVILAIVVVVVTFIFMVSLIRFTRR